MSRIRSTMAAALLLLSLTSHATLAQTAGSLRVTDRTNLRDRASSEGATVVSVSVGDVLQILEVAEPWFRVRTQADVKASSTACSSSALPPNPRRLGRARAALRATDPHSSLRRPRLPVLRASRSGQDSAAGPMATAISASGPPTMARRCATG